MILVANSLATIGDKIDALGASNKSFATVSENSDIKYSRI